MSGSALFSSLLGYASVACWLGAQLPQVFENFHRQSCDGLALPFLANWFLGDFSNLMGCILTGQLPFQRYLAIYFCSIDLVLLFQYIYYQNFLNPLSSLSPVTFHSRRAGPSISASRRLSADRSRTRYHTLSAVASDNAVSAALAARYQDQSSALQFAGYNSETLGHPHRIMSTIPLGRGHVPHDSEDEHPVTLVDSFYSESSRDIGKKRISWSIGGNRTRANSSSSILAAAPSNAACDVDGVRRGRSLRRDAEEFLQGPGGERESSSSPRDRRNSRAGKRSATMVFLGTWALFGVGTFVGNRSNTHVGGVLPSPARGHVIPIAVTSSLIVTEPWTSDAVPGLPVTSEDQDLSSPMELVLLNDSKPSLERTIGRISAWLCTTLYLTSRLPQIWKNFVRKSVEGLSMYLFVFAFLGNIFYVASILFSPNVYLPSYQSAAFLKESIPYLLGSGGTLVFDITIVAQSFIYKSKHSWRNSRSRSRIVNLENGDDISEDVTESERTRLLAGHAQTEHRQVAQLESALAGTAQGVISAGKVDFRVARERPIDPTMCL